MIAGEPEVLGEIGRFLVRFSREGFSGVLRVEGAPGGTLWIRDGLLVAATTPAAPGPESLLLRSGRVSEREWTDAYAAGAPRDRLAAELAERGVVGAAGLEAVCLAALFDAVFAMVLCGAESCGAEPAGPDDHLPLLPVLPGVGVERLARETARRMELAATWRGLGLSMRVRPVPPAVPAFTLLGSDRIRAAVLERANGRRTPRDIAFVLGKGLFAVMSEIARMVEEGVLDPEATPERGPFVPEPGGQDVDPASDAGLPRRRPGTSRINEVLAPSRPLLALRSPFPLEAENLGPADG